MFKRLDPTEFNEYSSQGKLFDHKKWVDDNNDERQIAKWLNENVGLEEETITSSYDWVATTFNLFIRRTESVTGQAQQQLATAQRGSKHWRAFVCYATFWNTVDLLVIGLTISCVTLSFIPGAASTYLFLSLMSLLISLAFFNLFYYFRGFTKLAS